MTDDLPMHYPDESPANPGAAAPKKCRRHEWWNHDHDSVVNHGDEEPFASDGSYPDRWVQCRLCNAIDPPSLTCFVECARCGKRRDPALSRRSRNNKNRGLAIQRKRIEGLGGTNLAGNNENLDGIGLAFAYESKSGGAFSERIWRWLTGIPTKGDQTGVLIVTETPGPGRRARSYVVVEYGQWRDLHGESKGDEA